VDETYVRVKGKWCYLYRAIDADGNLVDSRLSEKRDMEAAQVFFKQALAVAGHAPERVTTDGHTSYPRAIRETIGNFLMSFYALSSDRTAWLHSMLQLLRKAREASRYKQVSTPPPPPEEEKSSHMEYSFFLLGRIVKNCCKLILDSNRDYAREQGQGFFKVHSIPVLARTWLCT
jgi:hypothetical protein